MSDTSLAILLLFISSISIIIYIVADRNMLRTQKKLEEHQDFFLFLVELKRRIENGEEIEELQNCNVGNVENTSRIIREMWQKEKEGKRWVLI